ncbi:hypothetical protein M422DRAFT_250789 [Sphaerobolus stellatus SS14]|uniref:Mid2 domain-containing protein n=1 Tax=Sphaerobolus stellatus (strain SS14) TaxID=990650 RepID=A0A0C9VEQ1_SPHS4|nr:hypothetical protein M422DRAFT_250789 [Sphaerobolus stellatus SS14]
MPGVALGFPLLLISLSFFNIVSAFTFSYTPPTQCDPFTLSWSGGTPPFDITLIPEIDSPRKFTTSSFPENGSFTLQLPLPASKKFVVVMSDSTGFAAGGVSELLTVGSSITQASCSTDVPTLSFLFDLPTDIVQCQPYNVTWDTAAVLPVTITGVIPMGKPAQLISGNISDFFVWEDVNVPQGTSILFFVTDSEGRFGGTSHIYQVGSSSDNSCINSSSPQSTTGGPTATSSTTQSGSSATAAPNATVTVTPSTGISAAAIGGAVVGGLVACLILGTLVTFFFRTYLPSKRSHSSYPPDPPSTGRYPLPPNDSFHRHSANPLSDFSHGQYGSQGGAPPNWTTFSSSTHLANDYGTEPLTAASSVHAGYPQNTAALSQSALLSPAAPSGFNGKSTQSVKSSDYPPTRPARFILHTDAEDEEIELPPQYKERPHDPSLH